MKVTVFSHASMLIENQRTKLMTDPWLLGSCYWRSWWNYPKPLPYTGRVEDLSYIYISHHHWDHFHGPSLRVLPQSATVLVPKAHHTLLIEDLLGFGFKNIVEMPHGKTFVLESGLKLTSYHFGLSLDSTLVIENGETTIVNMNDCKITGLPLRQFLKRHPRVDLLFRSHSSASVYPHCVDAEDERDLQYRTNQDYMTEFLRSAEIIKPRYAIPFASNHCYLHKETIRYNSTIVSPLDVKGYFDRHKPEGTDCHVMMAGDVWDSKEGFHLQGADHFTNRQAYLQEYAKEVAPKLEAYYLEEDKVTLPFSKFKAYFSGVLEKLPLISRSIFRPVVAFQRMSVPDNYWIVDFGRRSVYETTELPSGWSIVIKTHPAVLRDCLQKRMFTVFMPSKRLSVQLAKGALKDLFILTQVLEMVEYGYFPLVNTLNHRFITAWLRRWREVIHYMGIAAKMFLRRKKEDPLSAAVPRVTS